MAHLPIATPGLQAPADAFTWFIYASSLDGDALAPWCADHGYPVPDLSHGVPSRLEGHRLAFNVQSRFWGGAVASLAEAPGCHVEGVAVAMPGTARAMVNHKEGAVSGLYVPMDVSVTPLSGGPAASAITFRGASGRVGPEQAPSAAFLAALIRGAERWRLSPEWISGLRAAQV